MEAVATLAAWTFLNEVLRVAWRTVDLIHLPFSAIHGDAYRQGSGRLAYPGPEQESRNDLNINPTSRGSIPATGNGPVSAHDLTWWSGSGSLPPREPGPQSGPSRAFRSRAFPASRRVAADRSHRGSPHRDRPGLAGTPGHRPRRAVHPEVLGVGEAQLDRTGQAFFAH